MNVNLVTLVGRVSRDPELKHTQSGKIMCAIGLATNRDWKDANGVKNSKTEWHNLVFWGKLAEIVGQYVTKGQEIWVRGRIEYREYVAKDGHNVKVTDIIVEDMQMGARSGQNSNQTQPVATHSEQPAPKEELPTINLEDEPVTPPKSEFDQRMEDIENGVEEEVKIEDVPF